VDGSIARLIRKRAQKSIRLPEGWARNSVNTSIYRGAGLVSAGGYQFGAYYESSESIVLFKRHLASDELSFARLPVTAGVEDAHNCVSLGCDSEGFLHLSHNQHGSKLAYVTSLKPHDITGWSDLKPMSGFREQRVTYPYFLTPRSPTQPLLFLYRDGSAVSGDVHLKSFDVRGRVWRDHPEPILAGSQLLPWTSGPYFNHPAIDSAGTMHLFFTWRTAPTGRDQLVNNHNVDYARSSDFGVTWLASNGQPLLLPITPVNTETVFGTAPGSNLMNQCGAAVDSSGRPFVAFYCGGSEGIRLFVSWHDGVRWSQRTLTGPHAAFSLVGRGTLRLPISRPDLVLDRQDRAWLIYRQGAFGNRMIAVCLQPPTYEVENAKTFLLWSRDLGFSEPVVDRGRLAQDGVLSMFLQRTEQGDHEELLGAQSSPAFVADWSLGDTAG
jgi:hypothetical protein